MLSSRAKKCDTGTVGYTGVAHELTLQLFILFRVGRAGPDCSTCKVRYCGKHKSQVRIDAVPVGPEWVECPAGARLEILSTPEVSPPFAPMVWGRGDNLLTLSACIDPLYTRVNQRWLLRMIDGASLRSAFGLSMLARCWHEYLLL